MNNIQIFSPSEIGAVSFKQLLPKFFDGLSHDLEALSEAFKKKNREDIWNISHKIKGSAATYSAVLLFNKAKAMQEATYFESWDVLNVKLNELSDGITISRKYAAENF